jgi:hypothetical protein
MHSELTSCLSPQCTKTYLIKVLIYAIGNESVTFEEPILILLDQFGPARSRDISTSTEFPFGAWKPLLQGRFGYCPTQPLSKKTPFFDLWKRRTKEQHHPAGIRQVPFLPSRTS